MTTSRSDGPRRPAWVRWLVVLGVVAAALTLLIRLADYLL